METKLKELTQRLTKQQARAAKHARSAERIQAEIDQLKKQIEQRSKEPVVVAGITWGGYLTPSEHCDEPSYYNEDTGLHYFSQKSAILHAYEQNKRLPTKEEYQHCTNVLRKNGANKAVKMVCYSSTKRQIIACSSLLRVCGTIPMERSTT